MKGFIWEFDVREEIMGKVRILALKPRPLIIIGQTPLLIDHTQFGYWWFH